MHKAGEHHIPASPERVWQALHDTELLRGCLPDCRKLEYLDNTHLTAEMVAKVGPVKTVFAGTFRVIDRDPPQAYDLQGRIEGRGAGSAYGRATFTLQTHGTGTDLGYQIDARLDGKLAQITPSVVDAAATRIADDFFDRFKTILAIEAEEALTPAPPVVLEPAAKSLPAAIWVPGLIVLVLALMFFFAGRSP